MFRTICLPQVLELCDLWRRKRPMSGWRFLGFRVAVFVTIGLVAAAVCWCPGFQPISRRYMAVMCDRWG